MDGLFLEILNMSISASWLIVVVILIRALMGKAPKGLRYVLWALVGIRLLCPISIESALSMVPSAETFSEESMYSDSPEIHSGVAAVDKVVNPILSAQVSGGNIIDDPNASVHTPPVQDETDNVQTMDKIEKEENTIQDGIQIAAWVWVTGIVVMLIYSVVCYVRLKATLRASMQMRENLWVCDEIQSPFILGLVRPRIYMPSYIEENHIPYIVAHENEHLKYFDHWWKPLGFVILSLHWFNPLVWVAYVLLCRDIELACDERVIQHMDVEEKKKYSKSLLLCSNVRHIISACPVAFGEIGVRERIKSIVNYKKPVVWATGIGILVCVIIAICFMTNPKQEEGAGVDGTEQGTEIVDAADDSVSGSPVLTKEELKWFETEFFNDEENWMPNMFLASEYSNPADIDLSHLFYGGANGRGGMGEVSAKEVQLLMHRNEIIEILDFSRATTTEMNAVLQQYMGITLEETNKIGLKDLYYLAEYDAYYNMAGDTMMTNYDFGAGWINEDGTITLQYYNAMDSFSPTYQVTLRKEENNYYFISNVVVNEELIVDVGVIEDELTLMQEVLFNRAPYNHGLRIVDVEGLYRDEYERKAHFYIVDLDRDGVDEVCVEYASGSMLIFHEMDGVVYGYEFAWRGFHPVYTDGTFGGSGGAQDAVFYGNVSFENYEFSYDIITSVFYSNEGQILYYKDGHQYGGEGAGVEITEEEYNQIMENYSMEEVETYEFTVENILKYVK